MYRLFRRRGHFLNPRLQLRLLAYPNVRRGQRQNSLRVPLRPLPMAMHALRTQERPRDIPVVPRSACTRQASSTRGTVAPRVYVQYSGTTVLRYSSMLTVGYSSFYVLSDNTAPVTRGSTVNYTCNAVRDIYISRAELTASPSWRAGTLCHNFRTSSGETDTRNPFWCCTFQSARYRSFPAYFLVLHRAPVVSSNKTSNSCLRDMSGPETHQA